MKKEILIEGMMCSHCEKAVKESLSKISSIDEIKVNADNDKAEIISKTNIADDKIKEAIKEAGYKVNKINNYN
ncbi:MAG: heavy-metal-associated domain-containing protein [Bacillota bacterium]